jgi:hypothetical protein
LYKATRTTTSGSQFTLSFNVKQKLRYLQFFSYPLVGSYLIINQFLHDLFFLQYPITTKMKFTTALTVLSALVISTNAATQSAPFKLRIASTEAGKPDQYAIPYIIGAESFKLILTAQSATTPVWRLNQTANNPELGYLTISARIPIMPFAVKVAEDLGSNISEFELSPKTELDQAKLTVFGIDKIRS